MKKKLSITITALFFCIASFAQSGEETNEPYPVPKWVSEKGYWVVESNLKTPDKATVYFYTSENVLVYQEKLNGVVLNLKKRKTKMNLKQVLEQSVFAYEQNHRSSENEMWVANTIKH